MKIKPIYWIALALAIALGIAVCDGLRIRDKDSVVAGQYQEALAIAKANDAALTLQIAKMTAIVGQKDKEIAEKIETIGHMTNAIGQKDKELDKIRATWSTLSAECVQKLHELDATWGQKFSIAEAIIAEKDKIITAWTAKFDAQVTISESWKQKYESELHLRTLAEKGWGLADAKIKKQVIVGNIKTGIILAAAGYIGLNMLTKGK
jgi:hypothetical protein